MDTDKVQVLLAKYIEESTVELFTDIGFTFRTVQGSEWLPDVTAIIGIAGTMVAGSVALCTSSLCLATLATKEQAQLPEDWLGELANQLVGRFKRRVASHGAAFGLGTPTIVLGERLRLAVTRARKSSLVVRFESEIGRVEVWLEIAFRDGFQLSEQPEDDGSLVEGEALLF